MDPPPAYTPQGSSQRSAGFSTSGRGKRGVDDLPLNILFRILNLTLDPLSTPSRFSGEEEEEKIRRLWALFKGPRNVNKRFFLVCTNILRNRFIREYQSRLIPDTSSNPFPYTLTSNSHTTPDQTHKTLSDDTSQDAFAQTRESAIFDRFIATQLGNLLRETESSLTEPSGDIPDLFKRLQPCARIEDLLLLLPNSLITPTGQPKRSLPLPWDCLIIHLSPSWVSLIIRSCPVNSLHKGKVGKDLVIEVRRQSTPEQTVQRLKEGLEDMQRGFVHWGERVL